MSHTARAEQRTLHGAEQVQWSFKTFRVSGEESREDLHQAKTAHTQVYSEHFKQKHLLWAQTCCCFELVCSRVKLFNDLQQGSLLFFPLFFSYSFCLVTRETSQHWVFSPFTQKQSQMWRIDCVYTRSICIKIIWIQIKAKFKLYY